MGARDVPYADLDDLWRRAEVPVAALERIAEADGFAALGLDRRGALWAIRGLAEVPLPLFAAADAAGEPQPEAIEPAVALAAMPLGREVVEDYASVGLSLRRHPVSFLRHDLAASGMIACDELARMRDGRQVEVAGIVLMRQKPGSAKGVLFMTVEDETGIANLILWPALFAQQRRLVLSAGMVSCRGRVQREGLVLHIIAERLADCSALLRSVGARDADFPLTYGRGDGATYPGSPDARTPPAKHKPRDIFVPDAPNAKSIKVPTRDFR